MSFISKIENLNKNLEAANNAGQIQKETLELAKIYNQILENHSQISEITKTTKIFENKGLKIEINNQLKEIIYNFILDIQNRYNQERSSDIIKKGSYSKYLNSFSELVLDTEIKIKKEWKVYCTSLYSREPYSTLFSQFNSPENETALNEFEPLFQEFSELMNLNQVSEISEETFTKVIQVGSDLSDKRSLIQDNYHEDVRNFLTAVENNRATLDLYTDEVINWINDNNLQDRYRITNHVN
jgi:hypothetical protein